MSDESPTIKGVTAGMDLGDSPLPANLPSLRRVQPKFSRNTIEIRRDVKREWHEVPASLVTAGDTVAEVGQVANVRPDIASVRIEKVMGYAFHMAPDQKVLAFIRV